MGREPDSTDQNIEGFQGPQNGYTNPRSTSQALDVLLARCVPRQHGVRPTRKLVQGRRLRRADRRAEPGAIRRSATLGRSRVVAEEQRPACANDRPGDRRAACFVQCGRSDDRQGGGRRSADFVRRSFAAGRARPSRSCIPRPSRTMPRRSSPRRYQLDLKVARRGDRQPHRQPRAAALLGRGTLRCRGHER